MISITPVQKTRSLIGFYILEVIDYPQGKSVNANLNLRYDSGPDEQKTLVLWSESDDSAYTKAGQWTDTDVINRIKELLSS